MPDASAFRRAAQHVLARSHGLLGLLLPRVCSVCERLLDAGDTGIVCGRCWGRAQPLPHPQCERCGHPCVQAGCGWCSQLPPYVRAIRSAYWVPGGSAGAIVHALKYAGWHAVAEPMAERMARLAWPADVVRERTALVPVPLAGVRERERGYNQSERLAHALAAKWNVSVWPRCLERTRATQTQTRLTPEERRRNVSGAFRLGASPPTLRGAHIVLVDDVVTTGATLSECAATLFAGGARIVSIVTFGRAPAAGDRVHP